MNLSLIMTVVFALIENRDSISKLIGAIAPLFGGQAPTPTPPGSQLLVQFDVKWLQTTLNKVMHLKLTVDGVYGDETHSAVKAFQVEHMTADDIDGWAGPLTCARLFTLAKAKGA